MKKIIGITLIIILIFYLLLLSKYLVIEEILGFYFIPIILAILVASLLYFVVRIFKEINYRKYIIWSFVASCLVQVLILCIILSSAKSQYFTQVKVANDIDFAISKMQDIHPNLYHSISKEEFYRKADSLKSSLPQKVSIDETYRFLKLITSLVRDGHTYVDYQYRYKHNLYLLRKTLPYRFLIRNDRIFVTKNYCYRKEIPIGSEIIEINGKSAKKCLSEVSQLINYETETYRNSSLEGSEDWSLWNNYKSFRITYKAPNSEKLNTIRSSGGLISNIIISKEEKSVEMDYHFSDIPDNIEIVEINSFNNKDRFKAFLDSTFRLIQTKKINNLIIDVRRNGGGDSHLVDELMQYISNSDFCMFDSCKVKVSNELVNNANLNWLDSKKRIICTMINDTMETTKNKLRVNPLRYKGQLYLLIGGNTFSSASGLASEIQCYKRGKLVGNETGGLTACFGDIYVIKLPNTGFKISVSTRKYYNSCGIDNGRGVIPDYIVENSFEDDQKGIDRVLEFTVDLIKKDINYGSLF